MTVAQAAVDRQFQFLRLYGRHISADITQMTGRKPGSESLVVRVGLGRQAISGLMGPDSRRRAADAARHGCVAPRLAVVGQAPDVRRPRAEGDERPGLEQASASLVYVGNQRHWLNGAGVLFLLRHEAALWQVKAKVMLWIS